MCLDGRGKSGGQVAPFVGAWIEIENADADADNRRGRSLCGSVD